MSILNGKNILLGVTGSIAAYKACEIVRLLTKAEGQVQVMMTRSGVKMVGPATFAALSGNEVLTDIFPDTPKAGLEHIHLAETLDAIVVAPATANIIGKTANGIADDLLSTTLLACNITTLFAPAMNFRMWQNEATQVNVKRINQRGIALVNPEFGSLASHAVGVGRMAEPGVIVAALKELLEVNQDFTGKHIIVTAGPTMEPIDVVRYISNRSSGKMGYAIAQAALDRGAIVTLVSGPTSLVPPDGCRLLPVETAEEMKNCMQKESPSQDIILMAAAVADFKVKTPHSLKIKKEVSLPSLTLEKTPDILGSLRAITGAYLVGFALEVENGKENALKKLREKRLDAIILNYADRPDSGFETDTNEGILFFKESQEGVSLPLQSKIKMAHRILDEIKIKVLKKKQ